ncbi:unnamed protein product [Caenorhabditis nigoni]
MGHLRTILIYPLRKSSEVKRLVKRDVIGGGSQDKFKLETFPEHGMQNHVAPENNQMDARGVIDERGPELRIGENAQSPTQPPVHTTTPAPPTRPVVQPGQPRR